MIVVSRFLNIGLTMALLAITPLALAAPKTFAVDDHRNVVSFTSDAPVELIKGHTNQIEGTIKYDDTLVFDSAHPFAVNFAVDLAGISTGIKLRDEHLRDNFLEAGKYPKAIFKVKRISTTAKAPIKDGQTVTLNATGDFTLHGVTRTRTIPVQVTYFKESPTTKTRFSSGDMLRVRSHFPVKLADHHIKRPQAVFTKLAETVYVDIDAFAQQQ